MKRKIEMLSLSALLASSLFQFSGNSVESKGQTAQVIQDKIPLENITEKDFYSKQGSLG